MENPPQAYASATKWIGKHSYKISDKPRERYIDGCWSGKKPKDY